MSKSKANRIIDLVEEAQYGTLGEIRKLERKLGIPPADMSQIPDMYDYLSELQDKAKAAGLPYKIGTKEDLWPASQPGPGDGAKTQLMPEQGSKEWQIQTKNGMQMGNFKAVTPQGALEVMAKSKGYPGFREMNKALNLPGKYVVIDGFRIVLD